MERECTYAGQNAAYVAVESGHNQIEQGRKLCNGCDRTLAEIVENVPGGVCEVILDDALTLLYGNKCFYRMYGYTKAQMRDELGNHLVRTIFPADLPHLQRILREALAKGEEGFESEHRIIRRDGTVQWSLVRGAFSRKNGRETLDCITVDITSRKDMEEALRVNEERFRLALTQTENTIFDYDLRSMRMLHAGKAADKYGLKMLTENVPDSLVKARAVHPDSAADYLKMYRQIQAGAVSASCEVRVRLVTGEYVWRRISMTNVFDGQGKAVRAVGYLEDIDDQKQREEGLRWLSERDTLTGIYNKGATEDRISAFLKSAEKGMHALLIVDIDEFKSVNDHHGHLFGDKTLAESARRISGLFHRDDIIGRIGGDEFIVFMKNLCGADIVKKRAGELCGSFQKAFETGSDKACISCSVGVAIFPVDGKTFDHLYQNADIALYEAKKCGKNQFRIFSPELKTGSEWTPYSNSTIDAPCGEEEL